MFMPAESKKHTALRKAEDQFTRAANREQQFRNERDKAKAADAAKIARLRALRLAKEAADKEAADADRGAQADEPAAAPKRKNRKINVSP